MYWIFPENEDLSQTLVAAASRPTDMTEKSRRSFRGTSFVFKIKADDNAWPYSAEYPPVLKLVPLNINGENRPLEGVLGIVGS